MAGIRDLGGMTTLTYTMITGDVARVLGLSVDRIKELDDELQPIRLPNGHRRYDPAIVARVAERRSLRGAR
jgi:DNA-binding transcriptional MerR regulator